MVRMFFLCCLCILCNVVFCQGVLRPYLLQEKSVVQSDVLLQNLQESKTPLSRYFMEGFSQSLKAEISEYKYPAVVPALVLQKLIAEMNNILFEANPWTSMENLCEKTGFAFWKVPADIRSLLFKPAFSLDMAYQAELEKGNVEKKLQDGFASKGFLLSSGTKIENVASQIKRINDSDNRNEFFLVQDREGNYQVYDEPMKNLDNDSQYRLVRVIVDLQYPQEIVPFYSARKMFLWMAQNKGATISEEQEKAFRQRPEYEPFVKTKGLDNLQIVEYKETIAGLSRYSPNITNKLRTLLVLDNEEKQAEKIFKETKTKTTEDAWAKAKEKLGKAIIQLGDEIDRCEEAKNEPWLVDIQLQTVLYDYNWLFPNTSKPAKTTLLQCCMRLHDQRPLIWEDSHEEVSACFSSNSRIVLNKPGEVLVDGSLEMRVNGDNLVSRPFQQEMGDAQSLERRCEYKKYWTHVTMEIRIKKKN